MNAKELYESGRLYQAIAAMTEEVKAAPQDINKRDFLRELLCVAGELERADKQLDILAGQDARATVGAALMRQLIRAEQTRRECFLAGRLPEFIGEPSAILQHHLQALIAWRENDGTLALTHLQKAQMEQPPVQGTCNGKSFQGFRDLDDTCAHFFEVLTSNGKYYWLGFLQIQAIQFYAPERPLDLVWRRAHVSVIDGPEGDVYVPALYINTPLDDETARLGLKTDWQGGEDKPVTGIGQRIFLAGDVDLSIMEINELTFNGAHYND